MTYRGLTYEITPDEVWGRYLYFISDYVGCLNLDRVASTTMLPRAFLSFHCGLV